MNEEVDKKRKPNNLRDILVNTETLELNVSIIILYLSFIILTICYAYRFNHINKNYIKIISSVVSSIQGCLFVNLEILSVNSKKMKLNGKN